MPQTAAEAPARKQTRPRFCRNPVNPKRWNAREQEHREVTFSLNHHRSHHLEILRHLERNRGFSTTEHIAAFALKPNPKRKSTTRAHVRPLANLYHFGFIERRYAADNRIPGNGSGQTIHLLTKEGSRALLETGASSHALTDDQLDNLLARKTHGFAHDLANNELALLIEHGAPEELHVSEVTHDKSADWFRLDVQFPPSNRNKEGRHARRFPDQMVVITHQTREQPTLVELDLDDDEKWRKNDRIVERFRVYAHALFDGCLHPKNPKKLIDIRRQLEPLSPSSPTPVVVFITKTIKRRDALRKLAVDVGEQFRPDHKAFRLPFLFAALEGWTLELNEAGEWVRARTLRDAAQMLYNEPFFQRTDGTPASFYG